MTTTIPTRPAGVIDSLLEAYVRLERELDRITCTSRLAGPSRPAAWIVAAPWSAPSSPS